ANRSRRRRSIGQGKDGEPAQRTIAPDSDCTSVARTRDRAVGLPSSSTVTQLVETNDVRLPESHPVPAERDANPRRPMAQPVDGNVRRRARERERPHRRDRRGGLVRERSVATFPRWPGAEQPWKDQSPSGDGEENAADRERFQQTKPLDRLER